MKKTLLLISLCVASQAWSAVGDMVPLPGWKGRQAANGDVIVKMEQVNSTGTPIPTPAAGGTNVVLNGISGAAATVYYDKLTNSAVTTNTTLSSIQSDTSYLAGMAVDTLDTANLLRGATSTARPLYSVQLGWTSLTRTAYTGVTTNATVSLGLTATAGTSAYKTLLVKMWAKSGVTSINALVHPTATPGGGFAAGTGPEIFPSDNGKTIGVPVNITDGNVYYFSFVASALSGAASGTVWYEIWGQ